MLWLAQPSPMKLIMQDLLGSSEGLIGAEEQRGVGDVSTWESWYQGLSVILPCACFEGQHYSGIIWGQGCLFSHHVDKEGHIHNGNTINHQ